jgi:hypothetical protein
VYVEGVPPSVDMEELRSLLERVGTVRDLVLLRDTEDAFQVRVCVGVGGWGWDKRSRAGGGGVRLGERSRLGEEGLRLGDGELCCLVAQQTLW